MRLVPRRPLPQPDVAGVRGVPRALARARPRERVERARVRVRGWVCQHLRRVRAVRPREIQARARQRDVQRVPREHQHDGGRTRGVGGVPVRAGLPFGVYPGDCQHNRERGACVRCQSDCCMSCFGIRNTPAIKYTLWHRQQYEYYV